MALASAVLYSLLWIAPVLAVTLLLVALLPFWERKVAGRMQARFGPNRVGPNGWLQPIADLLKLLIKEDITPTGANAVLFTLAPIIVTVTALISLAPLPFAAGLAMSDLNLGLLYVLSVGSIGVYGIMLAGWASNNKFAMLGGLRSTAQMISYEIPLGLALLPVVMQAGTMSLGGIVEAQQGLLWGIFPRWGLFTLPPVGLLAFAIYLTSGFAETNRQPFDLPEAEAELVAGFHTEYSGMRWSLFFLAEYVNMLVVSAIAAVAFLGGWGAIPLWLWTAWNAPFLILSFRGRTLTGLTMGVYGAGLIAGLLGTFGGFVWFALKVGFLMFVFMWVRWTWPRYRYDQLMQLGWLRLVPLALVNVLLCGLLLTLADRWGLATLARETDLPATLLGLLGVRP